MEQVEKSIVLFVNNPLDDFNTQNFDKYITNNFGLLMQAPRNMVLSFQNKI